MLQVIFALITIFIIITPLPGDSIYCASRNNSNTLHHFYFYVNSLRITLSYILGKGQWLFIFFCLKSCLDRILKQKKRVFLNFFAASLMSILIDITVFKKGAFAFLIHTKLMYHFLYPFAMTLLFISWVCLFIWIFEWYRIPSLVKSLRTRFVKQETLLDATYLNDPEPSGVTLKDRHQEKKRQKKEPNEIKTEKTDTTSIASTNGTVFALPHANLLDDFKKVTESYSDQQLKDSANLLQTVLDEFGVKGEIENIRPGPIVTLYEFKPAPGIKTSRVISLADDIARSMSAVSARIATVTGQNVIGIELPNKSRQMVYLKELLNTKDYTSCDFALPIILGKDIGGKSVVVDLTRMPHLLVAGTTGSGKSVAVNVMILSLLFKMPPHRCKFIMIDPKMLELSVYDDIPHLLTPVVTDPKKAIVALKWAVKEMENRYRAMSKLGVRNIDGYNKRLIEAKNKGEILTKKVQTGFDPDSSLPIFENQPLELEEFPYIVIIVDEMADLMLVAGKEIEAAVQRLAQMARAAGIHLIMATQRPSVDVITGTIKANFPTRMSFQVTSKIDSRTILGEQGAEQLLGQGDMLYMVGGGRTMRVHGPFLKDTEVERIVSFLKAQGEPHYIETVTQDDEDSFDNLSGGGASDDLYQKAVQIMMQEGKISTSFLQRHLKLGYNRAATIVEQMEKNGLISPANHAGKREILMK